MVASEDRRHDREAAYCAENEHCICTLGILEHSKACCWCGEEWQLTAEWPAPGHGRYRWEFVKIRRELNGEAAERQAIYEAAHGTVLE